MISRFGVLTVVFATLLGACGEPTVALMAASRDLDEGTELDPSQLVEVRVSRVLSTTNSVREDTVQPLLGKRLRISLKKGDLVLASSFEANPGLSERVVKKARAVTLSVSGAENVHPGDHVDLLAVLRDPQTNEWTATTEAQNVIVLAAGNLQLVTGNEAFPLRRVTFLLISEEAETALLTVRMGALHVSLRNPDDVDVMAERGRATANTVLGGERRRLLETLRNRVISERTASALPQPHPTEPLPQDTAPVPMLPGKQEP